MGLDEVGLGRAGSLTGRLGYASVGQGRMAGRARVGRGRMWFYGVGEGRTVYTHTHTRNVKNVGTQRKRGT